MEGTEIVVKKVENQTGSERWEQLRQWHKECKRAGILSDSLLAFVVQVNVLCEIAGCTTFKVNLKQRAKEITEHVWSKTKVPMQDQVLQLGSKTLKSQRTLSSCGIDKETPTHLTLKVVKPSDEELPLVLVEPGDEGQRHDFQV